MQTLTRIKTGPAADYTVVADMDAIWIHAHDGMHTETMRIDAEALEAVGVALIAAAAAQLSSAKVADLIEGLIAMQDARAGDPEAEPDDDSEPDADAVLTVPFNDREGFRLVVTAEIGVGRDDDAEPETTEGCLAGEDLGTFALDDHQTRGMVRAARLATRRRVQDILWKRRAQ